MNRYTRIATILALLLAPPCWAADDAGTIALTIHYANRNGIIGESKLLITVPENATIQEVKDEIVKIEDLKTLSLRLATRRSLRTIRR